MTALHHDNWHYGLTTSEALYRLRSDLSEKLDVPDSSRTKTVRYDSIVLWLKQLLNVSHYKHTGTQNKIIICPQLFCVHLVVIIILIMDLFATNSTLIHRSVQTGACIAAHFILLSIAICISVWQSRLKDTEMKRKAESLIDKIDKFTEDPTVWTSLDSYPSNFLPHSEAVHLQWTIRDGHVVNIPWILLVKGDVVVIRPGREIPCRVRILENTGLGYVANEKEMNRGQIYIPDEVDESLFFTTKSNGLVKQFPLLLCEVCETTALGYFDTCLNAPSRPVSVIESESFIMLHRFLECYMLPITLGALLFAVLFRYFLIPHIAHLSSGSGVETFLTMTAIAVIPLTPSMPVLLAHFLNVYFSACLIQSFHRYRKANREHSTTWLTQLGGSASFYGDAISPCSSRSTLEMHNPSGSHLQRSIGPELARGRLVSDSSSGLSGFRCGSTERINADENSVSRRYTARTLGKYPSCLSRFRLFMKLLRGDPKYMIHTGNVMHAFGNLTSFSVVDKKGVLSWANPVAEKLFFMAPPSSESATWFDPHHQPPTARSEHPPSQEEYKEPLTYTEPEQDKSASISEDEIMDPTVLLNPVPTNTLDLSEQTLTPSITDNGAQEDLSNTSTQPVNEEPPIVDSSQNSSPNVPRPTSLPKLKSGGSNAADIAVPHVFDLTVDSTNKFQVQFDDPQWQRCLAQLKPLGLNILLNSCNLQEHHTYFLDFLGVVSEFVPRTLAVVSRRCLCNLAEAIGFNVSSAPSQYKHLGTLGVFRPSPGEQTIPGVTKHRTPIANIFSAVVSDTSSGISKEHQTSVKIKLGPQTENQSTAHDLPGHSHVLSQGTAELVSEACGYYWNGTTLRRLNKFARKKIADFYQRSSITAYCVALSYHPLTGSLDPTLLDAGYLEWMDSVISATNRMAGANRGYRYALPFSPCRPASPTHAGRNRGINQGGGNHGGRYAHGVYCKPSGLQLSLSCDSLLEGMSLESQATSTDSDDNEVNNIASEDSVLTKLPRSPSRAANKNPAEQYQQKQHHSVAESSIDNTLQCLSEVYADQVFLGLVSMQYQAKPDVVELVAQLDRGCIRFIHFSKENELRSRVFAEKMGLEAGWNCHISLCSEGSVGNIGGGGTGAGSSRQQSGSGNTGSGNGGTAEPESGHVPLATNTDQSVNDIAKVNHESEGLIATGGDGNFEANTHPIAKRSNTDVPQLDLAQLQRRLKKNVSSGTEDHVNKVPRQQQQYVGRRGKAPSGYRGQIYLSPDLINFHKRRLSLPRSLKFDLPLVHFRATPEDHTPSGCTTGEAGYVTAHTTAVNSGNITATSTIAHTPDYDARFDGSRRYSGSSPKDKGPNGTALILPVRRKGTLTECSTESVFVTRFTDEEEEDEDEGLTEDADDLGITVDAYCINEERDYAMFSVDKDLSPVEEESKASRERTPLLSDATSHTSVMTSHSSVGQPMIPSSIYIGKEARLPKGIENVRPHIENVDNVPLLVPLFTDCTPETAGEMLHIMQDYGEVVCVLGSSLNYMNARVFSQANCAIAIEPSWPAICLKNPKPPAPHRRGPIALANLLSSLPCSLSIRSGQNISITQLIAEARHYLAVTRAALLFLFSAIIMLPTIHFLCLICLMPPVFSCGLITWLSLVALPILTIAVASTPLEPRHTLEISTTKNLDPVKKKNIVGFLRAWLVKFLPSVVMITVLYFLSLHGMCPDSTVIIRGQWCSGLSLSRSVNFNHSASSNLSQFDSTWDYWKSTVFETQPRGNNESVIVHRSLAARWILAQNVVAWYLVFYLILLSSTYVNYRASFRDKSPLRSRAWLNLSIVLICGQFLYSIIDSYIAFSAQSNNILSDSSLGFNKSVPKNTNFGQFLAEVPYYVHIVGFVWSIVALVVVDFYKRREINMYKRDQRRRKLSFNTKLGMNSPF